MEFLHPFSSAIYENADDGNVRVKVDDKEGLFTWDGRWLGGAIRWADPNMCIYVAGGYGGSKASKKQRAESSPKEMQS